MCYLVSAMGDGNLLTRLFWEMRRRLPQPIRTGGKALLSRLGRLRPDRTAQRKKLQQHLSAIVTQHRAAEPLIFAPSVRWNVPLFQRPHQLALALARLGRLVFFCEPPYSDSHPRGFHAITSNLYVANVPLDVFQVVDSPVIFVLAYNAGTAECLSRARRVYEYIDELDILPGDPAVLKQHHTRLLRSATVVLATANRLWQQIRSIRPDAQLCPNGVDYDFIQHAMQEVDEPPPDLAPVLSPSRPVIGYYGALANWFDYELLLQAAGQRPGYVFVLIGPNYDGSLKRAGLGQATNIHWLGPRPYTKLPHYLKYFSAAMIPFRLNPITHATSPLKLFEYMAGGKPVVTTGMQESMRLPGVIVSRPTDSFAHKLDQALEMRHDVAYLACIDQVARQNTWEIRAQQILDTLPPRSAPPPHAKPSSLG